MSIYQPFVISIDRSFSGKNTRIPILPLLQRIFRHVQISRSEGIVLDAILSKANMFGKHARVAYECLAAITGFSVRHVMRLVKSLVCERRLLRVG